MNSIRQSVSGLMKKNRTLHRWALKIYSIKHPPPYCQPNMEFEFDAWNAVSSIHYCGVRQLGEDNTGPYPYRVPAGNQYETCRFGDSRRGLPMNITNLRLVLPHAGDAYQLTTVLRNKYIARRCLDSPRFNLIQAYLFSKFAMGLPAYLTRRKDRPVPDGKLEALEGAFYMLGTAPYMLVRQLMVRGDPMPLDPQPLSAQCLYELSDASGVLLSTRVNACPASPKLICEFFDVIMNGSFTGPTDSKEVQRVLSTLGDWDRFYTYVLAASRIELLVKLNQAMTAQTLLALAQSHGVTGTVEKSLLQSTLENTIRYSYINTVHGQNASDVLRTTLNVLIALLKDHGEGDTLKSLQDAGFLSLTACETKVDSAETAFQIRQASALIRQNCNHNLTTVHRALGISRWREISEQDMLQRTAGLELDSLLAQLK